MLAGTVPAIGCQLPQSDGQHLGDGPKRLTVIDQTDAEVLLLDACQAVGLLLQDNWRHGLSKPEMMGKVEAFYQTGTWPGEACTRSVAMASRIALRSSPRPFSSPRPEP